MSERPLVEVLVLAGGRSRRMGVDKAALIVDGVPLIARVTNAVRHLGPVRVVGGSDSLVGLLHEHCGEIGVVSHVVDAIDEPGPFGALVHGLSTTTSAEVLVVGCDLAELSKPDVDRLVAARRDTDADLAVPMVFGRRQWHALAISRRIVPDLVRAHEDGVKSLHRGFLGAFRECVVVSSDPAFFADVDTPEDVAELRQR